MPLSMFDPATDFGARAQLRLETELVIWLTTVDATGTPQSFPVWFLWHAESETIQMYTSPGARRLEHLTNHPRVGAHFNTDAEGENVVVLSGRAEVDAGAPAIADNSAYLEKYEAGIVAFGMSIPELSQTYSVPLRFTPEKLGGH